MGKALSRKIEPRMARAAKTGQAWYGAVIDEQGCEIPITEAMIQRALAQLDARVQLPCPHHLAPRRR